MKIFFQSISLMKRPFDLSHHYNSSRQVPTPTPYVVFDILIAAMQRIPTVLLLFVLIVEGHYHINIEFVSSQAYCNKCFREQNWKWVAIILPYVVLNGKMMSKTILFTIHQIRYA